MRRTRSRQSSFRALAAALLAGMLAVTTEASLIEIASDPEASTEGMGAFHGTIEYVVTAPTSGLLTIELTHATEPPVGGYITGFLYKIASSDPDAGATLTSASHALQGISGQYAPPFGGPFDAGAAVGGNWLGGGKPHGGIAAGHTGSFVFQVSASDAAALSAASFISASEEFSFVVRFRGLASGGSDKVAAMVVPTPATCALLATAALAGITRRRR